LQANFADRFTGRAAVYSKYRPSYPVDILNIMRNTIGFDKDKIVADIGSGTGLLSRLFLENGNKVFGVEPNDEMRSLAEQSLSKFTNFVSIRGSAEETTLDRASVDLVAVGQALHWFDRERATREFARIVRKGGHACIVYNDRTSDDVFMQAYESIISKHARDRANVPEVDHSYLSSLFRNGDYRKFNLRNEQFLDFEGLLGRITSASYMPDASDGEKFEALRLGVSRLYRTYEKKGQVRLLYDTVIFLGEL
jgi:ubiquinone/menaquinone biosynthesis C-methylase UbiE